MMKHMRIRTKKIDIIIIIVNYHKKITLRMKLPKKLSIINMLMIQLSFLTLKKRILTFGKLQMSVNRAQN
jgi:hypothetical protein